MLPVATGCLALLGVVSLAAAALIPPPAAAVAEVVSSPTPSPTPSSASALPTPVVSADWTDPEDAPVSSLADPAWVSRIAQAGNIPERAMAAYAGAAIAIASENPGCGIGWNTLAAIGGVETAHGTINGARIGADGIATPAIIGVALNGDGTALIRDTDQGLLDQDTTWDHAVGPMQFIPGTWASYAQDGNLDGSADVHNIDDAALTAAVYLCAAGGDLTKSANWITAISAYNPSVEYNNRVAEAATGYARLR
jgi:membrane-bound lytic murein transglycosylase B